MNIVLATPPADGAPPKVLPPMGLLYIAASLHDIPGLNVYLVDGLAEGLTSEEATHRILNLSPDVLGLSLFSTTIERGIRLLKRTKPASPNTLTVVGGIHATLFDGLLLKEVPEIDAAFRGEAEHSFPEMCRRIVHGESIEGIPGFSYRANGEIVRGDPQIIADLDALPFPSMGSTSYDGYFTEWTEWTIPKVPKCATVLTSRGCPNHCTFCSKMPNQKSLRVRSALNVFLELQELVDQGTKIIFIPDDNFTADVPRLEELCHMIIDSRLGLRFIFQGEIHHLSDSTLKLMHQAGFDGAFVGVESGSDPQRRRYNKPGTSQEMADGIRRAKKAHIVVASFFIAGGLGETDNDAKASEEFIRKVKPHVADIGGLRIYPGSALWRKMVGPGQPEKIEDSRSRLVYDLPGGVDEESLKKRLRDFRKTFASTWLSFSRIFEVLDLLLHNRSVRMAVKGILKNPQVLFQLFRESRSGN